MSTAAALHKRQCDVYDSGAGPTKLVRKKSPTRWDVLSKVGESEYEKDIMTRQAGNRRDCVVISVYLINFYNVQNLICLTLIVRSVTHDYQ